MQWFWFGIVLFVSVFVVVLILAIIDGKIEIHKKLCQKEKEK